MFSVDGSYHWRIQGDGAVAGDAALVFPRLGDGDDGRLPPLSRDLRRAPGAVDDVQQGASSYRAEVSEHLVGDPVGPGRLLQLQSADLHHQCFHAERDARFTPPRAPAPAFLAGTQLQMGQLAFGLAVQLGVSYLSRDPGVLADERFSFGAVGAQQLPAVHHRLAVAELVVAAALPLLEGFVDPTDVCRLVEGGGDELAEETSGNPVFHLGCMSFCRDPALSGTRVPSSQVFARGSAGTNRLLQLRVQCPRSRVGPRTPRDVTNRGRPRSGPSDAGLSAAVGRAPSGPARSQLETPPT